MNDIFVSPQSIQTQQPIKKAANEIYLTYEQWDKLYGYFAFDQNVGKDTIDRNRSVFFLMCKHMNSVPFNPETFDKFIAYLKNKNHTDNYINEFIRVARLVDKVMGFNQLQRYQYLTRIKKEYHKALTAEELQHLALVKMPDRYQDEHREQRYRALVLLLTTTG
jgi:hypothetical protein